MGVDLGCIYSTVKNTSGVRKTFGFLPPHGRTLDANEEFVVFGDVKQSVIRFERTEAGRNIKAFENAIKRGDITIVSLPAQIITDDADPTGTPKMLRLHNGVLGTTEACWASSTSLTYPAG